MSQTLTRPQRAYYQFNSCLRKQTGGCGHKALPNKTKKAQKSAVLRAGQSLPGACSAIKSRAACAHIYWAGGRFGTKNKRNAAQKQQTQGGAAGMGQWATQTGQKNRYEFNSRLRNQIKGCRPKTPSKQSISDALKGARHAI